MTFCIISLKTEYDLKKISFQKNFQDALEHTNTGKCIIYTHVFCIKKSGSWS